MDGSQPKGQSHLFLVRLWLNEDGSDGEPRACHGKVQHIITGNAASFNDLPTLDGDC